MNFLSILDEIKPKTLKSSSSFIFMIQDLDSTKPYSIRLKQTKHTCIRLGVERDHIAVKVTHLLNIEEIQIESKLFKIVHINKRKLYKT